jgi:hypothetical protein
LNSSHLTGCRRGAAGGTAADPVLSLISGAMRSEAALVGNLVVSITVQQVARTGVARLTNGRRGWQ